MITGQRPADVLKMRLSDIRGGFLWLSQGKTRKELRMGIAGELAALIERIQGRTYKVTSMALCREVAAAVKCFQFRDLRAKAGTDKADATDMREAQQQLGHKSVKTTEIYLRSRAGEKVTPTK